MADTKTVAPKEGAGTRFWNWLTETQVWTSVFRHDRPDTDRGRVLVMLSNVFLHLHPVRIRKSGVKLRYTWCMGGLSFFLFLVLTFTGLLLMFYYRPTLEYAYTDIVGLREHVPLGIMREMHRWGAHAMVITVWLHMFRVFMTGSYKPPREFNWSVGVIMLVLTLLLSFTGYLLPWDQLAIWAITVGSNMARATPGLGHEGPYGELVGVNSRYDARSFLTAPSLLLLDEPTTGLDPRSKKEVQRLLDLLRTEREVTVLLCTHDMDEAAALCDRVLMMDGGRVLADGTPDELIREHGGGDPNATLEDVFMHLTGKRLDVEEAGGGEG